MKKRFRILFALSITALFVVGVAFGATNLTDNMTDVNETNVNENITENSIEAVNMSQNTTVEPDTPVETTIEPTITVSIPVETTMEPAITASIPKPSPGIGSVIAMLIVISTIYIFGKRR